MISAHLLTLARGCALLAVLVSAALLSSYLSPSNVGFCGVQSGCEAVRKGAARWFGDPHWVPLLGVAAYVATFGLSFFPKLRRSWCWLGIVGGAIAVGLLLLQPLMIGAWCKLCVTVDVVAVGIGLVCAALLRTTTHQHEPLKGWAWTGLFALAINAPTVWERLAPQSQLPEVIAELQQPGALNVFEFVDFQCPHCRRLYPLLEAELARVSTPVHFRRFHVPLAFHPLAGDAARAAVCAEASAKGHAMAELLFEQPLTSGVWLQHAARLGLDTAAFERCLQAESTTRVLTEHRRLYDATGGRGLPLTFIGEQTLAGTPAPEVVTVLFLKALAPPPLRLPAWAFVSVLATCAALLIALGRRRMPSSRQR